MIEYISGKLTSLSNVSAIVDVNGIGYLCFITSNTYDNCPEIGNSISLLIHFNVSENSHDLYGFLEEKERDMFRMLISISGIGPKTAISMLSNISPNEFKKRIIRSDVNMLTEVKGIGPKTAKRIIIELKDKFVQMPNDELPIEKNEKYNIILHEAFEALLALGFKSKEINKVFRSINISNNEVNTEVLIRKALKLLN